MVGFEEESYTTSEMFRGVTVCASVANGNVVRALLANINIISGSATGEFYFDMIFSACVGVAIYHIFYIYVKI